MLLALVLAGCGRPWPKTVSVRPVLIRVVDGESGAPLPGVSVTRVLSTWKHAALHFEPLGSRYFTASYVTDTDGRVSLPSLPVRLSGHEYLRTESIFVNLEAPPVTRVGTAEQEEGDRFGSAYLDGTLFRPFASNEGLVIVTEPNPAAASERHDRWKGVLQRWRRVQGGLERPEAELVILLAPSAPAGAGTPSR